MEAGAIARSEEATTGFNDSFTFSRMALDRKSSVNYSRDGDILLHLIVRPEQQCLVLNENRNGDWGKELRFPLSTEEMEDAVRARVWSEAGSLFIRVGSGESVAIPRFAGLTEQDQLKVPTGIYHRRSYLRTPAAGAAVTSQPPSPLRAGDNEAIAPPASAAPAPDLLPRQFGIEPGESAAGAVDYFDRAFGIRGWAFEAHRPRFPLRVHAMCDGEELAISHAILPRPDLTQDGEHAPNAGFAIAWQRFNLAQLEAIAARSPGAAIEIHANVGDTRRPLANVYQPIPASMALEFVRAAQAAPPPTENILRDYELIAESGVFDADWYRYNFLHDHPQDALLHYLEVGEGQGYPPNFYLDPEKLNSEVRNSSGRNPLAAYCENRGGTGQVSIHFDEAWYVETYSPEGALALADYLAKRHARNPNPYFDVAYYLTANPDVAVVHDPYEHFVRFGVFEGRRPSETLSFTAERLSYPTEHNPFLEHLHNAARGETAAPVPALLTFEQRLRDTPLFDYGHYAAQHAQSLPEGVDPLIHFVETGDRELLSPNALFDASWYLRTYFKRPPAETPFLHYLTIGERNGLHPSPLFDPEWYSRTYSVPQEGALSHYLANRASNQFAPNEYFDPAFYLDTHPDIRAANIECFGHWFSWGIFENRRGSPRFDADYVWRRYLNNNRSLNAFTYFMDIGRKLGWQPVPAETDATVHREIRHNTAASPLFEELAEPSQFAPAPSVKTFAFYLPQFHAIAENDEWWGTGFTEWRNLPRGVPRFAGHYQPRVPRDLGFYELTGTEQLRRHADLAQRMGITGFAFYYYNFNGHRLLEKPLDAFVGDDQITMPFSIIWANENWTRRWDGMEKDVLMRQDYRDEDRPALVDDLARYLTHPRYHRIGGRPILPIYRPDVIPDCANTIEAMRADFIARYGINPIFTMAQAFGATDPRDYGFEGAFEFPPHKVGAALPLLNDTLEIFDVDYVGQVRGYDAVVEESLSDLPTGFPIIKAAFPNWDNDARKQGSGLCFVGSTPQKFQTWVAGIARFARQHPFFGEPLIFINAWNEWCEGAYLEPDCHYGFAYLNALSRGIRPEAPSVPEKAEKVVLVGHDAFPAGAQEHLIHWGRVFKRHFGSDTQFVLLSGGALVPRYREVADTFVADEHADPWGELRAHLLSLRERGYDRAVVNTTVAGTSTTLLAECGFKFVSLVHELPTIIRDYHLDEAYGALRDNSLAVVYPNTFVGNAVQEAFGQPKHRAVIRAQGLYKQLVDVPDARAQVLAEMGLPEHTRLVLNIGYLDMRKGVDLFVQTAAEFARTDPETHFIWVGKRDEKIWRWVSHDAEKRRVKNFHYLEYTPAVDRFLQACDVFFISSREDPFPSVVLEALACGKPVVAFAGSGGHAAILDRPELGEAVAYLEVQAAKDAIRRQLAPGIDAPELQEARKRFISTEYNFEEYVADVAALIDPQRPRVSVIVPSYNYAHYMEARLSSIFNQTAPVFEIIVLDDCSKDSAADVARSVAHEHLRSVEVIENERNSGNVFRQWKKGLDLARGDYIWIAEADDVANPRFLERAVDALNRHPDAVFAFSDSHALDADGALMYESYKGYYSALGDHGLEKDAVYPTREFLRRFLGARNLVLNASAVVWRTDRLRRAFETLKDEAFKYTCAGDWRVYIEGALQDGEILYIADPLNGHRRHDDSVTHALKKDAHLKEIQNIHAVLRRTFKDDRALGKELDGAIADLKKHWEM